MPALTEDPTLLAPPSVYADADVEELRDAMIEALDLCIWRADTALPLQHGECQRLNTRCTDALANLARGPVPVL